jgi:alkylhydroperoxidase family enzyme
MVSWIEERSGYDVEAVAAWEAKITGRPQRIEPLQTEELDGEARELVDLIRTSAGSAAKDAIPEYFRTMAKHPPVFRCQTEMGTVLFRGSLPPRDRELAILRNAWLLRAPYEWGEHVKIGKRHGITPEEIERIIEGSQAPGWSDHDRAILRAVEELLSEQAIGDETWATLARRWDERQLIEFPMMVGQYVATALVQNALRMRLAHDNPGLTHR